MIDRQMNKRLVRRPPHGQPQAHVQPPDRDVGAEQCGLVEGECTGPMNHPRVRAIGSFDAGAHFVDIVGTKVLRPGRRRRHKTQIRHHR